MHVLTRRCNRCAAVPCRLTGDPQEEKLLDQPELYKKLAEGSSDFTFRDMYEQFQNLLKLGPLGKVMSMIPGLSNMIGPGQ